jgi:hypothetical protein
MSRIDEALRRAAEQAAGDQRHPAPIEGAEADRLAREPYPVELDRRVLRAPSLVSGAAAEPADVEPPRTNGKSLFERMDARLAD